MSYDNPTLADFKSYFVRDFPFGANIDENVLDADVTKAMGQADIEINQDLFVSQAEFTIGFQLLSAHHLVSNLRTSSQGLSGQFAWLQSSRGVGSVSESLSIPENIASNPMYAYLTKTNYGAQYLMLVYSRLVGTMYSTPGGTRA